MPQPGTTEFIEQLNRAADLTGGGFGSISTAISPTLEVGPGAQLPVSRFVRNTTPIVVTTGDATHSGYFSLINPANSGFWIVVEKVSILNVTSVADAAMGIDVVASNDLVAASLQGVTLDGRNAQFGPKVCNVNGIVTPPFASLQLIDRVRPSAISSIAFTAVPFLLNWDQAMVVWPIANTQSFYVSAQYRIHEVRPS